MLIAYLFQALHRGILMVSALNCYILLFRRNYPLLMAAWKVAPALAAGCAAILKPSELASVYVLVNIYDFSSVMALLVLYLLWYSQIFRTCLELADVCQEVGLPPGVLNILTGLGHEAGAPLASHPHVDKVLIFTNNFMVRNCIKLSHAI